MAAAKDKATKDQKAKVASRSKPKVRPISKNPAASLALLHRARRGGR